MPMHQRRVLETQPFNASTDPAALGDGPTPASAFFVRNHFPVPYIDKKSWRLRITGGISGDRSWSCADLASMPRATVDAAFECAGNGRHRFSPTAPGVQWDDLAIGQATWTGVPLVELLNEAGRPPAAVEILATGLDEGQEGGRTRRFERSLALDQAAQPDVLVADSMNGQPLPQEHGGPARLIVPGHYGVASVKWLDELRFLDEPFSGWFQKDRYVMADALSDSSTRPLGRMRVKSLILAALPDGGDDQWMLRGVAWSGEAAVAGVEISVDGGVSWNEAKLGPLRRRAGITTFEWSWTAPGAGPHEVRSRARDEAGNQQPPEVAWNRFGYGHNGIISRRIQAD